MVILEAGFRRGADMVKAPVVGWKDEKDLSTGGKFLVLVELYYRKKIRKKRKEKERKKGERKGKKKGENSI